MNANQKSQSKALRVYRVTFLNQAKVYEVYAREVHQGEIYGFVELQGLVFGEAGGLLVNPGEERLKEEFKGVRRTLIPSHAVIRIDEVEKEGPARIHDSDGGAKVTPFPGPLMRPGQDR